MDTAADAVYDTEEKKWKYNILFSCDIFWISHNMKVLLVLPQNKMYYFY